MDDGYRNALMTDGPDGGGRQTFLNALMQPLRDRALNGPPAGEMLNQLLLAAGFLGGTAPTPSNARISSVPSRQLGRQDLVEMARDPSTAVMAPGGRSMPQPANQNDGFYMLNGGR